MMGLVSVIMPVYNAEKWVEEAINSVLSQTYSHLELLIVNDGSIDNSSKIIQAFEDERIRYFEKTNEGVSKARNLALDEMNGDYFCFIDSDDVMPSKSIENRLSEFKKNENLDFVDGCVMYVDENLLKLDKFYKPNFNGNPKNSLLNLDGRCMFGNTWMIKKKEGINYSFDKELTHSEDLFFYLSICNQFQGNYGFTSNPVLLYRQLPNSAMSNLDGLAKGYFYLLKKVKTNILKTHYQFLVMKLKITKIMFLSYLFDGRRPIAAMSVLLRYLFI